MRNRGELFQRARSYALYYGENQCNKLAHYDIVILEPSVQKLENIRLLQEMDTLVLGYVSIMELGPFHHLYSMLQEEDFLQVNGKRIYKEAFNTYVLDLKSRRWLGLLHYHVGRLLLHEGYDGIFMDTIGNAESPIIPPAERNIQLIEATELVRTLRKLFPNHVLVQNNGLEQLCKKTGKYLNGLCWENPLFSHKDSQDWCQNVLERIVGLKIKYGVRSIFLHEENYIRLKPFAGIMAQAIADKYDFLYYMAMNYYKALP